MPPSSCERAVRGLMIRPAEKTPSSRGTRTSPVSASTRASANCAPKECSAYVLERRGSSSAATSVDSAPSAGRVAVLVRGSRRAAATIAEPQRAGARPSRRRPRPAAGRVSPICELDVVEVGTPSASAAIWRERGPGAGADVGGADRDGVAAVRAGAMTARPLPGIVYAGYVDEATPVPTSQSPSRRRPGAGRARAQPNRSAPCAQAVDQLAVGPRAARSPGRLGLVADRAARSGRCRRRRRARPSPTRARTCPGISPGARIHDGTATSSGASRCVVRRCGGGVHASGSATAVCSANSLTARSARRPRGRSPRSGRRASAPSRTRWRSGCGSRRARTSAAGSAPASPGGRAALRGQRGEHVVGVRHALGAEAAADVRRDDPDLLRRRGRTAWRERPARRRARPGWSRRRSAAAARVPQRRCVACGSIGLLCSIGVV